MEEISLSAWKRPNEEFLIRVNGAHKKFHPRVNVLRGLNMEVKRGTIYGLLGPSGCGKTTLLNCLVGRLKLDGGTIQLGVNRRSQIGYMPQELALFEEFSIQEHLTFYGLVHLMTKSAITEAGQKLKDLLELPDLKSIVSTLSGGQQRRVSLSIALLHNPEILILDEPTVGIDVVLSQSIWNKLVEMSELERKTVIITTHYIQEARRSNIIGLMRNGKMLAEDEPQALMDASVSSTLEEAFLKLCQQEEKLDGRRSVFNEEITHTDIEYNAVLFENSNFKLYRFFAYTVKSFTWMKRNIVLVLFTLMLPIVQSTLISITVGEDPRNLSFGVVNTEANSTYLSRMCQEYFQHSSVSGEFLKRLSDKGVNLMYFNDTSSARFAAVRNRIWGFVYFNDNYSKLMLERMNSWHNASDYVIYGSDALVWLDLSHQVISEVLKKQLETSMLDTLEDLALRCKVRTWQSPRSFINEMAIYGNISPSFRQFMTPANAVLFAFYLPLMFTLGAMLMEKTAGLLERGFVAGLTLLEVTLGHSVLQMVILIIQTSLVIAVLYFLFDNPTSGNLLWCAVFLLLVGMCGMSYGFFIATLCDRFSTASCLAVGSYFPLFMLSGALWPIEGMHSILKWASLILPITTSVEAYRSISVRSWTVNHPTVYTSLISLIIWTTGFIFLSYMVLKRKGNV